MSLPLPTILAMTSFLLTLSSMLFIAVIFDRQMRPGGRFPSASETRAARLLNEWLSPTQRLAYESHKYFDVIGCDSGTLYRIHHGAQANIEQLNHEGDPICRWCFAPRGDLATADVMLAQKLALETRERSAIGVANRLTIHPNPERSLENWRPTR